MQSVYPYIKHSRYINKAEELAFFRAVSIAIKSVFKDDFNANANANVNPDTPNTISQMLGRDELVHVFEAAQQPDQLSYSDIYKVMHDYANTAVTGMTLHDRDVSVPLNFTAFEIIHRHSAATKPRVASIPPVPHSFVMK